MILSENTKIVILAHNGWQLEGSCDDALLEYCKRNNIKSTIYRFPFGRKSLYSIRVESYVWKEKVNHYESWWNIKIPEPISYIRDIFFDFFNLWTTLNENIVWFLKVIVFWIAVFMFVYEWIKIMTARWNEEQVTEAKNKIFYSVLALIFLSIIETWKRLAYSGNIPDGIGLISSLVNLALFFAAPTALFFLTLAGYYYITSNGDEERAKKWKTIIINIILAIIILIACYTFLLDLITL